MSMLSLIKERIVRKEIVSDKVLHQVQILENYIKKVGGCELVEKIADNAVYVYASSNAEYLLRIDMSEVNITCKEDK